MKVAATLSQLPCYLASGDIFVEKIHSLPAWTLNQN